MTGAVVIVGPVGQTPIATTCVQPRLKSTMGGSEMMGAVPLACIEILGRSAVQRFVERLREARMSAITLLASESLSPLFSQFSILGIRTCFSNDPGDMWRLAGQSVTELFAEGFEIAVVARLGAYLEFEWDDLLQFHQLRGQSLCRAHDGEGPLDFWVVGRQFMQSTMDCEPPEWAKYPAHSYVRGSYVNRLKNVHQLRQLAADCLHSRCSTRPSGKEMKPGVWVDDSAHVNRKARVVAPSYIGKRSRVQAAALITRSSSIEHDCEVDGGTVVEDTCVLANTYLGRWLDVSHAVVNGGSFTDLRSDVTVEILDGALVRRIKPLDNQAWRNNSQQVSFVKQLGGRMRKAILR